MEAVKLSSFEPFSKRMKKRGDLGSTDVYYYNILPETFRIQVIHVWKDAFGESKGYDKYALVVGNPLWLYMYKIILRELGILRLGGATPASAIPVDDIINFFLSTSFDEALDIIDILLHTLDKKARHLDSEKKHTFSIHQAPDDAIDELNHRFREHSIGYKFEGGELIRIDSQYIHSEVVKPTISLLQEAGFEGAEEEFFKAHKHYRNGEDKEAIVNALKAFESTMKAICEVRGWPYNKTAQAKDLIGIMFDKQLLPSMLVSSLGGLRASLEGLATIRNKTSGHGQGIEVVDVPQYLASYALHLAASNIVLLVEAHKAKMQADEWSI